MDDCLFCKIVKGEVPCTKVFEDEKVLCFKDIKPEAPVHVLIIPKQHISNINELDESNVDVISHIFLVAKDIAKKFDIEETGYRLVANCGENAGQTVQHIHFHMLGGKTLQWP